MATKRLRERKCDDCGRVFGYSRWPRTTEQELCQECREEEQYCGVGSLLPQWARDPASNA